MAESGLPDLAAPFVDAVESAAVIDPIGERVGRLVRDAVPPGKLKDALSGTWVGHALHPLLTDVVIGSFTSASMLDGLGGDRDGTAARRLIGIGIAAYVPTALTGVSDYADSELNTDEIRRVGAVHAAANAVALGFYAASLRARRRGDGGRGKLLALVGMGALGAAGHLGGHLTYRQGIGVDQTVFDPGPEEWSEAAEARTLSEGEQTGVRVGEVPVLLVRRGGTVHALHDRCSHRGCRLSDGELDGNVIVCACHGSRFRLADGSVELGPATAPQPAYETRERDGTIEVRLTS